MVFFRIKDTLSIKECTKTNSCCKKCKSLKLFCLDFIIQIDVKLTCNKQFCHFDIDTCLSRCITSNSNYFILYFFIPLRFLGKHINYQNRCCNRHKFFSLRLNPCKFLMCLFHRIHLSFDFFNRKFFRLIGGIKNLCQCICTRYNTTKCNQFFQNFFIIQNIKLKSKFLFAILIPIAHIQFSVFGIQNPICTINAYHRY